MTIKIPYNIGQIVWVVPNDKNKLPKGDEQVIECRFEGVRTGEQTYIRLIPKNTVRAFYIEAEEINKSVFDNKTDALLVSSGVMKL